MQLGFIAVNDKVDPCVGNFSEQAQLRMSYLLFSHSSFAPLSTTTIQWKMKSNLVERETLFLLEKFLI